MDNTVTVSGNLTRSPELRFTTGGRGVCTFGLAVSRRYQQNNEWVEQTSFFNVTAWATLGENVAATLDKGHRVVVTGRLEQRSWETPEGEKRSVVEIVADDVGPSLKWATVAIERNERTQAGDSPRSGSGGPGGGDPIYGDEEPF